MRIADRQVTGEISKQIIFNSDAIWIRDGWDLRADKGGEMTVAFEERQNIVALAEFVLRSQKIRKRAKFIVTGHDIRRRHSQIRVVDQSRSFPSC